MLSPVLRGFEISVLRKDVLRVLFCPVQHHHQDETVSSCSRQRPRYFIMSASPAPPTNPAMQAEESGVPTSEHAYDSPEFAGTSEPPSKKARLSPSVSEDRPDEPNETIYIRNLNEDVPLSNLKATLTNLFGLFGKVVAVQAQKSVRMRGQAFVTMATPQAAATALQELQGFMLYGRTLQPYFAQHRSSITVMRQAEREAKRVAAASEGVEAKVQEAQAAKDEKIKEHKEWLKQHQKKQRRGNTLKRKELENKIAEKRGTFPSLSFPSLPFLSPTHHSIVVLPAKILTIVRTGDAPQAKSKVVTGFADDYLPPNKVLFLQGLPDSTTQPDIEALLVEVGRVPTGFEVRTVPRNPNIAFVEFADIATSATVKTLLDGHEFSSGDRVKATFAR